MAIELLKDVGVPLAVAVVGGLAVEAIVEAYKRFEEVRNWLQPVVAWWQARPWLVASVISVAISLSISLWTRSPRGDPGPPGPQGLQGEPGKQENSGALPPFAVVAFAHECPSGWITFKEGTGRFIVGAGADYLPDQDHWFMSNGDGSTILVRFTPHGLLQHGGEEKHKLTVLEIPTHDHPLQVSHLSGYDRSGQGYEGTEYVGLLPSRTKDPHWQDNQTRFTDPTGGGQAHDIMPPFVALNLCIKKKM